MLRRGVCQGCGKIGIGHHRLEGREARMITISAHSGYALFTPVSGIADHHLVQGGGERYVFPMAQTAHMPRVAGRYPVMLQIASVVAAALVLIGLVVGIADPGPVTGIFLPLGLFMWWMVGKFATRHDASK